MPVVTPVENVWPVPFGDQIEALEQRFYVNPFQITNAIAGQHGLDTHTLVPLFKPNFPVLITVSPLLDIQADRRDARITGFGGIASNPQAVSGSRKNAARGSAYSLAGVVRASLCVWPDPGSVFWFDRLQILPSTVVTTALGNVVNDVDTTFEVFNAHRSIAAIIQSIDETNTDGFTFISGKVPPSPSLTIRPYRSAQYTLRAEAEFGPPVINALFEWVPQNAPFLTVSVTFTGNRITLFAFEPQVMPITDYEFLTSIVESYNGTEQRMAMRSLPRQAITYTYRKGDANVNIEEPYAEEAQAFEHVMFDSLGRIFALPVWEDRTVLTVAVAASDTVINLVTAGLDIQVGELIMLWRDWNDNEAQEVASLTATTVTVSSPFVGAFAIANTVVVPTFTAFADDNVSQLRNRLDSTLWRIRFNRQIDRLLQTGTSPLLDDDLQGLPVWPRRWGISGVSINRVWTRDIQDIGNPVGIIDRTFRKTVPRRAHSLLRAEIRGRTDFEQFRDFILTLKGRQKVFWLGSKYHNFQLTATAGVGAATLRVFNNFYTNFVAVRAPLDQIRVHLTDGTEIDHTITTAVDVGAPPNNDTDLGITPSVGATAYTIANVERIEYFTRHRMDTDRIRFQAVRPKDHYTVDVPIIEVINET